MPDTSATLDATVPAVRSGTRSTPQSIAAELAARPHLWRSRVEFRHPRHYVRLTAGDGWEAWLLTWLPGQATGLHDHGGSAGAFAVVQGALDESLPVPRDDGRLTLRTSRHDSGAVRAFDAHHLHDVQAVSVPAVSIHVYAPALVAMTRYALRDGVLTTLVHETAGADW